ncbi:MULTISPECIES: aminotransferase class I/II-fold pyridoxal phosphate-dependent enzyme [Micromonospora]|uniref:Aminotransferase n=3 Tax=Micromonospora TaxID=1873 RepID=A0A9X0LCF6_9ACTN|nr:MULTISPECIES: aminotransferase class I/II-fold pyridoxal phosphate-dependent enzyme [Micromonospora]AIS85375.1 putative aminotransferase [Verrucosispora sp. MS100047]AEB45553.1 putative aminotransferase [Micromonospora maris AB-18-032]KUJ44918.1 hypothetical protein ADL17_17455 [Micromonospora maris]MBL6279747.1 aminotransferase class I/II-fold pyridoxal phosphate-dependent enzyme [Micromonospora fiedleri]RUL95041.1 aminotransferase class I/II-fold pyridoxal phosphate-dependent enzyme [Verr
MTLLRSSLRPYGTSIFTAMSQQAARQQAVNLAQGAPDFGPPAALLAAADEAVRRGGHQYSMSIGVPALRQAVAADLLRRYRRQVDPETEVTVTAGASEAIWCAALGLLEPGDEAIVLEPCYEQYPPTVTAAGATVRYVPCDFPEFRLDPERLVEAFNPRTRLVFLNTPWNPAGRVLREPELTLIGELAEKYDAYLVADETYEHLTFDGVAHLPVAEVAACRDRTVTISSVSKTFSATGWRVGWAVAPPALTAALRAVKQFVTFAPATPLQLATAVMVNEAPASGYYELLRAQYAQRRAVLRDYLQRTPLTLADNEGTFFLLGRCADDDVEYCTELIHSRGVAAIPASRFYADPQRGRGLVRFAFCKRLDTLRLAGDRLTAGG